MHKIKVLVIPSDREGVGYFRSIKPHTYLQEKYADEFDIHIEFDPSLVDGNDEWLQDYDLIHYHKTLSGYDQMPYLLDKLNKAGVVTVMDIDDHWLLPPHHPNYHSQKMQNADKHILNNIKIANYITTTTSIFADEIQKYNKNVFVLPNAIDPDERQFKFMSEPSNRVRIGWLGGSTHLKDLEILKGIAARLKTDGLLDKIQLVLCGFNIDGHHNVFNKKSGEVVTRRIKPIESLWYQYERIFTDDYATVSSHYKDFLLSFIKQDYPDVANEAYRRVWATSVGHYASNYRLFDIALAPLQVNIFNQCKSQLKILEAGFYKKAIIAQDIGPYKLDVVNAYESGGSWNAKGNAILIDSSKNAKDWYRFIKRLVESPELTQQLGENLYDTVKDSYSISKVTRERRDLYMRLVSNKKLSTGK